MLETTLARVCAPALAGIKPANLAAIDKRKYPDFREQLETLDRRLFRRGIRVEILCECQNKALVLVYRPQVLENALRTRAIADVLTQFGYDCTCPLERQLARLRERMTADEFPHEIGAFLGYPAEDILGFLSHRRDGVLLVGEWKVYANADKARKMFSRYAACRCAVIKRLESGKTLAEIFGAA